MSALVCWLLGHVWRECPFVEMSSEVVRRHLAAGGKDLDRCRGACTRCGKHKGFVTCIVCERVAR